MKINYFRHPNVSEHDPWKECQFSSDTDFSSLTLKPLVSINGQPILRQHHSTYLTGKDTCRAHHLAKLLAASVLSGQCPNFPTAQVHNSLNVTIETSSRLDDKPYSVTTRATPRSVLWIDTVHGPHISAQLYHELVVHASNKDSFHLVCLDVLGDDRNNFFALNRNIEALISKHNPALVVIDDIDHFMPFCGINTATEFCKIVRDVTNHTETSFLFVGYNNLGKRASTTGNLGKHLFINASSIFSLSTQREVTTVRLVNSFDLSHSPGDTEFHFTIGPDNLPHEAEKLTSSSQIDDDTMRAIITDILQPGETITPDDLLRQVNTRRQQLKRMDRAKDLLNRALHLGVLHPVDDQQAIYAIPSSNHNNVETQNLAYPSPPVTPVPSVALSTPPPVWRQHQKGSPV